MAKPLCKLQPKQKLGNMQEREKRGDTWAPRFFLRTPDKETFANEYSDAECPLWEFNGEYTKLEPRLPDLEGIQYEHILSSHCFWRVIKPIAFLNVQNTAWLPNALCQVVVDDD